MSIYKPLKTGASPTLGTSGQAVKDLQVKLNTTNAGKAGYTPLAVDGKYGPLTQAASQYKAPVDTSTAVDRPTDYYARTTNATDKAIADTEKALNNFTGDAPDLASITREKRAMAQAVIDSVNASFQKTLDAQGVMNSGLNDRVRALNVNSGLGGSDFGTAAAVGQEKKNQGAIELINAEKSAKINEILAGVDSRASEEYAKKREEYVKNLGNNLDRLKASREEEKARAKESITGLAAQGVSIEKLKGVDSKTYNTLLKEYGGSQMDLETAWNASLPDNMKVKYETQIIKGKDGNAVVFRYGVNPITGTVDKKEYSLGVNYDTYANEKPIEADGVLYSRNPDGTLKPLTKKQWKPIEGEDPTITKELQDAQMAIDKGADPDKVRRTFLDLFPTKGDLFLKYTKQAY